MIIIKDYPIYPKHGGILYPIQKGEIRNPQGRKVGSYNRKTIFNYFKSIFFLQTYLKTNNTDNIDSIEFIAHLKVAKVGSKKHPFILKQMLNFI
jgi:hypothetical protein